MLILLGMASFFLAFTFILRVRNEKETRLREEFRARLEPALLAVILDPQKAPTLPWRSSLVSSSQSPRFASKSSLSGAILEKETFFLSLFLVGIVENFGYRQLNTLWRIRGTLSGIMGKKGWGAMTRKGFDEP